MTSFSAENVSESTEKSSDLPKLDEDDLYDLFNNILTPQFVLPQGDAGNNKTEVL